MYSTLFNIAIEVAINTNIEDQYTKMCYSEYDVIKMISPSRVDGFFIQAKITNLRVNSLFIDYPILLDTTTVKKMKLWADHVPIISSEINEDLIGEFINNDNIKQISKLEA